MPTLKFKRFNKPQILKQIGRDLLGAFFAKFEEDFQAQGFALPPPALPDGSYFDALAQLLMCPEELPDRLNEALFAIDEMAGAGGEQLLQAAAEAAQLSIHFKVDSTLEDIALQIWLAAPALLARTHNAQRLRRLTTFQYAGCGLPKAQRPPFRPPDAAALDALAAGLDAWFDRNHRGQETTKIEVYLLEGEYWFLVRHGATFTRTPKVERQ